MRKTQVTNIFFILTLFVIACNDETTYEGLASNPKSSASLAQNNEQFSSTTYCSGYGECLPVVNLYHNDKYSSNPGTTLSWTGNADSHTVTITIKGIGQDLTLLCGPSGSQHFSHHKTNYTATYSISCNSDSKCTGCRRSGSLIVIDDKGKSSTSTEDCGKKYLSYEIRSAANGPSMVKCTSPSLNIHNTKEYMPVNTYSIYTTNSGKPKEYIEGGAIVPDQTQIWLPNNPSQYYEIHLYNMSSCKKNSDHYIYGTYLGGITSSIQVFLYQKRHSN